MNMLLKDLNTEMPVLAEHREAYQWFKGKYGDKFISVTTRMLNNEEVYLYHLIINKEIYQKGMEKLAQKGIAAEGLELAKSYFIIEITEDGKVYLVY